MTGPEPDAPARGLIVDESEVVDSPAPSPEPPEIAGVRINEDWAATVAGLVLLGLVLVGVIGKWVIP